MTVMMGGGLNDIAGEARTLLRPPIGPLIERVSHLGGVSFFCEVVHLQKRNISIHHAVGKELRKSLSLDPPVGDVPPDIATVTMEAFEKTLELRRAKRSGRVAEKRLKPEEELVLDGVDHVTLRRTRYLDREFRFIDLYVWSDVVAGHEYKFRSALVGTLLDRQVTITTGRGIDLSTERVIPDPTVETVTLTPNDTLAETAS